MSTMLRSQFEDMYFERLPFIDHIIFEKYSAYPEQFSRYFLMNTSSRAFEDVTGVTGFDVLASKAEGVGITYDQMHQAYNTRFTHITYALGFRVSMESLQDDVDSILRRASLALGNSSRYTPEIIAADVFNSGFSSTTGSPDGVPLFDDSHPLIGGGTQDNHYNVDLSVTSLQSMLNGFAKQVDDRGKLLNILPREVVVPQELRWSINQILDSPGLPGSADNDLNSIRQMGLTWSVWQYLTDTDAFFILADPSETELLFYWRMQFTTDHDVDFDTGDGKSKIVGRFSVGYADHRGTVGSEGAA